tara:strand:+ start:194 stop:1165 length:972 start_codon:yes stop_codon:yes gene_type:complete
MARDDYGAISVISEEEREILGINPPKKPEEDEKLFETIGKAADKIGETKVGRKIGTIITIIMLALLSGGANLTVIDNYFNGHDDGPLGGCLQVDATNYNPDATFDDGSCNFLIIVYGCTNPNAENHQPNATHDDGRCVVLSDIPNGTNNNETTTIYGCMDIDANNYDDKATEDDGSCDYVNEEEEEHGNHTSVHFYPGWYNEETDNMTVFWVDPDAEGISVLTDIDTDCGDFSTSVLIYVDVWYLIPEDTEGEGQYAWKDLTLTVDGMAWDKHWLNFTFEELNETEGDWAMWVVLLVWDEEDEDYYFQQQFHIPIIRVEAPDE